MKFIFNVVKRTDLSGKGSYGHSFCQFITLQKKKKKKNKTKQKRKFTIYTFIIQNKNVAQKKRNTEKPRNLR